MEGALHSRTIENRMAAKKKNAANLLVVISVLAFPNRTAS
jgi:hypothetical protein